jgi:pimeloyl-ACP methyl ester carboxylesterase
LNALSFVGADVEQLRALAARFETQANKLTEIAVSSSAAIMVADWTGANIDRVRSEWRRTSKPQILALARECSDMATALKRNADEQDRASVASAEAAAASGRPVGGSGDDAAPQNLHGLVEDLDDLGEKNEIFRIKEVIGPDGETRFIVYFPGTKGDIFDFSNYSQLGGWGEDLPMWAGGNTAIAAAVAEQLRRTLAEHPDAEVMLVGFSQGGMVAQAIADSCAFNVKEVVTFGSPPLADVSGFGGANVTRMHHAADPVANLGALGAGFQSVGSGIAEFIARSQGYDIPSHSPGEIVNYVGGNPFTGSPLDSVHSMSRGDYQWLADQYQNSADSAHAAARARQSLFLGGSVVSDRWASETPHE